MFLIYSFHDANIQTISTSECQEVVQTANKDNVRKKSESIPLLPLLIEIDYHRFCSFRDGIMTLPFIKNEGNSNVFSTALHLISNSFLLVNDVIIYLNRYPNATNSFVQMSMPPLKCMYNHLN